MFKSISPSSAVRRLRRYATPAALLLALPAGGCGTVRNAVPPPVVASDYHERHPVVLAEAPHTIDVFPAPSGRLDTATSNRIAEFLTRYRRVGHGPITLLAPTGGPNAGASRLEIDAVRRGLAAHGVGGSIIVGTYPVADPSLAAPIRLSFQGIKAKVAGRCGEWPADLASGSSLEGWQNQSYWNFGCANQQTLAAQVADPRDLASPRGETDADIEMRMRPIGQIRKGTDPTTEWRTKAAQISSVGGGQ